LAAGELAINIKDKKLFFINDLGVLQSFDLFNVAAEPDPAISIQKSAINTMNQTNFVTSINNTWQ
jgi:hypothetical protein